MEHKKNSTARQLPFFLSPDMFMHKRLDEYFTTLLAKLDFDTPLKNLKILLKNAIDLLTIKQSSIVKKFSWQHHSKTLNGIRLNNNSSNFKSIIKF